MEKISTVLIMFIIITAITGCQIVETDTDFKPIVVEGDNDGYAFSSGWRQWPKVKFESQGEITTIKPARKIPTFASQSFRLKTTK